MQDFLNLPQNTSQSRKDMGTIRETWSAEDDVQLKQLSTDVAKAEADDPIQQAKRIRTAKITVAGLRKELLNLHSLVSDDNETGIKESISRLNSAIEACKLVKADDFSKEPLQGVGTRAWKRLYEAAKEYSVNVAYRGEEFPVVGDGKVCVWCMQELDKTAKERLTRFKKFMEDATQTELKAAKEAIQLTLETFKGTAFKAVKVFDPALDEIGAKDFFFTHQLCSHELQNSVYRSYQNIQTNARTKVYSSHELQNVRIFRQIRRKLYCAMSSSYLVEV